jgi:hypothetical protein
MGFPAASTPSTLAFPEDFHVLVWLFGGEAGSYFDFARLSFHIPTNGSLGAIHRPEAAKAKLTLERIS